MNPARTRFWDFSSALLLALVVQAASQRLVATSWTSSLAARSLRRKTRRARWQGILRRQKP